MNTQKIYEVILEVNLLSDYTCTLSLEGRTKKSESRICMKITVPFWTQFRNI